MEELKNFLESSTVHGLSYISTSRGIFVKLFWVGVVAAGFTGAGILTNIALQAWDVSPLKTTIESRPITELTLPKITVCPPKNTYTDLNYDLMMTENMTLDDEERNSLVKNAEELLQDYLLESMMANLSLIQDFWD